MQDPIVVPEYPHTIILPSQPNTTNALRRIRQEWQEAADGQSLLVVKSSVGLLLADICEALCLDKQERKDVLGEELLTELDNN